MSHHLYYLIEQNEQYKHLYLKLKTVIRLYTVLHQKNLKNIAADFWKLNQKQFVKLTEFKVKKRPFDD